MNCNGNGSVRINRYCQCLVRSCKHALDPGNPDSEDCPCPVCDFEAFESHQFKTTPLEVHTHCSCDYPMYIVAPLNCAIVASRGDPETDVYAKMTRLLTPDMRERRMAAREFLKKHVDPLNGHESHTAGFSWILASVWC